MFAALQLNGAYDPYKDEQSIFQRCTGFVLISSSGMQGFTLKLRSPKLKMPN